MTAHTADGRSRRGPGASPPPQNEVSRFGVVVLTQGLRRGDLIRALESLQGKQDVSLDIVVVGNGWEPVGLPAGVRGIGLPENIGIPAGRNAGVPYVEGGLLFFLDDDAALSSPTTLRTIADRFGADPGLGLIQPRVEDPQGLPSPRRWTPRLRVGDPRRSSDVAVVWEGGVALRRSVFETAHGWPAEFFYGHEGIELAWRVWDAGYRVRYEGDIVVNHPVVSQARHESAHRLSARNRVWLARRNLPVPVGAVYVSVWFLLSALRSRTGDEAREIVRGYRDGFRAACGKRYRLHWRTIWSMTRAGRPPII